jgi:hypothetical protein
VPLSGGEVTQVTSGVTASLTLDIKMDKVTDAVAVKENVNMFTSADDSFLSFAAGGVTDMVNLPSEVVLTTSAKQVTDYDADTTRGELQSYTLDLDAREIAMTFDEIMKISTFKASAITIQSAAEYGDGSSTFKRQLSGSTIKTGSQDSGVVVITLSIADQVALGENTNLATGTTNTFITMTATALDDTLGRDVTSVTDGNGQQAADVLLDGTGPTVLSSTLDLDNENLVITFDEPVNKELFSATEITLLSGSDIDAGAQFRALVSTEYVPNEARDTFTVSLVAADLNAIKLANLMAVNPESVFLAYTADLVADFAGEKATPVLNTAAETVTTFVEDETVPNLDAFKIDMENGRITFTFDEPIKASTLVAEEFTVQDAASATVAHTLTGGIESTTNGLTATIELTSTDLDDLKRKALASSEADTFIRLTADAVKDMNDQSVEAIEDGSAQQVTSGEYEGDSSPPTLDTFDLDMHNGVLRMTFSETVLASSVQSTKFSIANKAVGEAGHAAVPLTVDSTASAAHHTVVTIQLSDDDMNTIKEDSTLAQDVGSTYLSISADAVRDLSDNSIVSTFESVTTYTADEKSPELEDFSVDLNAGKIYLTFSETVKSSTLDTTAIVLSNGLEKTLTLQQGSDATAVAATVVEFTIHNDDLDTIKFTDAFVTETTPGSGNSADTFISFSSDLITDMAKVANEVQAVATKTIAVDGLTPDTTPPNIDGFALNINDSELVVSFSESLESSPIDVTSLTLSNADGSSQFTLTSGSVVSLSAKNKVATVAVSRADLNQIKARKLLGTSETTSLLLTSSNFGTDKSGNPLTAITQDDAIAPSEFDADATRPQLLSFELDLESKTIRLSFSEAVDKESIHPEGFTLLSEKSETSERYQLTGGEVTDNEDCN